MCTNGGELPEGSSSASGMLLMSSSSSSIKLLALKGEVVLMAKGGLLLVPSGVGVVVAVGVKEGRKEDTG